MKPIQIETERRRIIALWAVLCCVLIFAPRGIQEADAASPPTHLVSPSESLDNERAVLKQLWRVLDYGEKVGRIYYSGSCLPDPTRGVSFRQLNVRQAPAGKIGIAAVKYMLRGERNISAEEDDTGTIRIRIGRIPDAILHIRIPTLTLSPEEQYNVWSAIGAVQNASEVQSAMRDLHIRAVNRVMNMIVVKPADGLPHLPNVMVSVTVDQVLDLIAKTFRGAIVYKACAPPDQYDIDFADARFIYLTY